MRHGSCNLKTTWNDTHVFQVHTHLCHVGIEKTHRPISSSREGKKGMNGEVFERNSKHGKQTKTLSK